MDLENEEEYLRALVHHRRLCNNSLNMVINCDGPTYTFRTYRCGICGTASAVSRYRNRKDRGRDIYTMYKSRTFLDIERTD